MASVGESSSRANIRIEIKNDFSEEMDVDETGENTNLSDGEVEDGEISDFKENEEVEQVQTQKIFSNRKVAANRVVNQWTNNDGGFTTGVDIFAKDEQEKLQTRAQRFGLDPSDCKSMNDKQLQDLHDSLGITENDEINTRFEAIHMYGTREMSTQDIFNYFGKYGPASIEWINDESCNVLWLDRVSAARAFNGLSRPISGMPVTGKCDPFTKENTETDVTEKESKCRSILLISKDREVEISDETEDISDNKKTDLVNISDINIPIPPGYWRLGDSHPKAKHILLRFAKRTDKKPFRAEKFSDYYKKYGNPNFGGIVGLISESKKKRMKAHLNPNARIPTEPDAGEEVKSGNPWGSLAKNWHQAPLERPSDLAPPVPYQAKASKSILNRLGTANKRAIVESDEEVEEEEPNVKKSKVPRMRMYADEEEARIEKVKQMKKIRELEKIEEKMTHTQVPDLRNRIGRQNIASVSSKLLHSDRIPNTVNSLTGAKLRPVKTEIVITSKTRNNVRDVPSDTSDDDTNVQQKSKVTVVVKKPNKPTVASTIWSRLDREEKGKQQNKESVESADSDSESDSKSVKSYSSNSDSDSDTDHYDPSVRNKFSKALNQRPGFHRDLKSRLGLNTDHKSPLRIEINNDHFKKS